MRKSYILLTFLTGALLLLEVFYNPNVPLEQAGFVTFSTTGNFIQKNPDTLTWKLLGDIKFVKKNDKTYGEVMFPVVNTKLRLMNKRKVAMSGFIVPIDNKNYALSKNVFASCFFCGKSGPETIAGIKFRGETPKLRTDQYVTLVGTFRSNETDVDDWIYHIEDAVIVKGVK
ncbi:hypothetical protein [Flavobacterium suncheonense]|uniref:DUF3299 domain-containing protein n=1 Tax=Flavobacterium suncheonense GH29-5 = DSM 17707 TaxID=1121899 RepID=A0A0A2MAL8_9FLAO|nr:hypothetical protein [Flavobacterium suncheonense]KGO89319.1 hypothetical protein Q764_08030 [Flavobacterium suncheonense GH29-5 = DSM 17707]